MPGSSGNGLSYGYSIGGAADSENGYLIEGQDTENISGGYSGANVPFQFIQEVQIKSSGIEAEHGEQIVGVDAETCGRSRPESSPEDADASGGPDQPG